jgi:UDP-2,3-diacylglucosamine hydrolase
MAPTDPRCVFIADLHLVPGGSEKTDRFLAFVRDAARHFDRLYILGDLFDFWIGPRHLDLADYRQVLDALRGLRRTGLRAAFVPGNRDYQVGPEFARAAGVELLEKGGEIVLGGRRVHLAHGDALYNVNPRYTAYRRIAGARCTRRAIAGIPAAIAVRLVYGLRRVSRRDTPPPPFRSARDLLIPAMPLFARGIDVVVCGHLHRLAHVQARVGERACDLFVLGEWREGTPHLRYEKGSFEMEERMKDEAL